MSEASEAEDMRSLVYVLLLSVVLCLSGCGKSGETSVDAMTTQGYTVCDARGKQLVFESKPQRIASSFVYADEIILDLVDHQRIVGLSKWVHDPGLSMGHEQADDVAGVVEDNIESVVALKPDLIFVAHTARKEYIRNLEDMGIKVYVFQYIAGMNEIPEFIRNLGRAVGEDERAETLIKKMNDKLKNVSDKVAKLTAAQRRSALLLLRFGAIGGTGCIYNDVLTAAGIEDSYNRARSSAQISAGSSRILSKEEVVKANPDVFIMGSWSQGGAYQNSEEQLREIYDDPAYSGLTAIKNRQAIIIPQSCVNCLSHHVAEGIEKLYTAVYENRMESGNDQKL